MVKNFKFLQKGHMLDTRKIGAIRGDAIIDMLINGIISATFRFFLKVHLRLRYL